MIFRQLFDPVSSTYTYLLGCQESGHAAVIDPVYEHHARDTALIRELGLSVQYVLDTHAHFDHTDANGAIVTGDQVVTLRCGMSFLGHG